MFISQEVLKVAKFDTTHAFAFEKAKIWFQTCGNKYTV